MSYPARAEGLVNSTIRVMRPRLIFLEPYGAVPQALTLTGGVSFIAWRPRRLFLEVCRRGPMNFLGMLDVSGLQPCVGPTLKEILCHTRPFSRACDKYRWLMSWLIFGLILYRLAIQYLTLPYFLYLLHCFFFVCIR